MNRLCYLLLLLFLATCAPISNKSSSNFDFSTKKLLFENVTYQPNIKTVRLRRIHSVANRKPQAVLINLSRYENLVLEFDELYKDFSDLSVRVIHCNSDWTPSSYSSIQYIEGYNEYPIRNYQFSINTKIPYTHYWIELPKIKLGGNYLLVVYRGSNKSDIVLSRRFMVLQEEIFLNATISEPTVISKRRTHQQITFDLNFKKSKVQNPSVDIKTVVRQNLRWDNAIKNLKPTEINENQKIMRYKNFTGENIFPGGKEFRFFDMRASRYTGQGISNVKTEQNQIHVFLTPNTSRRNQFYEQVFPDLNGSFYIANIETPNLQPNLVSEYINVHFFLKSKPITGRIYILGEFTNWALDRANEMEYHSASESYACTLVLKQGWYNYQYLVKSARLQDNYLEGNHFQTENQYDILTYYRPIGARGDILAGYTAIHHNLNE